MVYNGTCIACHGDDEDGLPDVPDLCSKAERFRKPTPS